MITTIFENKLIKELSKLYPFHKKYSIENIEEIVGGADTHIWGFDFIYDTQKIELVARIYREGTNDSRAEYEFQMIDQLFSQGLSVPKPFFWGGNGIDNNPYYIMEKIEGELFRDCFEKPDRDKLFYKFIQQEVNIHQTDLKNLQGVTIPDLKSDPFMIAKGFISGPKGRIEKYGLDELKPLIKWLENNMKPSEEAVVIHGDYHHSNVIIKPDNTLVVIDWSNMRVSDFRIDLGFTATIEIVMSGCGTIQSVVDIYEEISGKKVKDLDPMNGIRKAAKDGDWTSMLVEYAANKAGIGGVLGNLSPKEGVKEPEINAKPAIPKSIKDIFKL